MTRNAAPALTFEVASDLYVAGLSDDGHDFVAEVYYVVATDARGNRWTRGSFKGARAERCPDTGETGFADVRPAARAAAERLLARIEAAGGQIDLSLWTETFPEYGSAAYSNVDAVEWEKRADRDGHIVR